MKPNNLPKEVWFHLGNLYGHRTVTNMIKMFFVIVFLNVAIFAEAQDIGLDSILNNYFEKIGGKESWNQLKTYYVSQRYYSDQHDSNSNHNSLQNRLKLKLQKIFYQYPDQYRTEIHWDGELLGTFLINSIATKAFNHMNSYEESYPKEMRNRMIHQNQLTLLGPTPLILSAVEKNSIEYKGQVQIHGKNCYQLVLKTESFSDHINVYLHTETYLAHAITRTGSVNESIYSDFREISGIMVPYEFSSYKDGVKYAEYKILDIEINTKIDDHLFSAW
jgi:outer membrane lipoprotein-sorting protein